MSEATVDIADIEPRSIIITAGELRNDDRVFDATGRTYPISHVTRKGARRIQFTRSDGVRHTWDASSLVTIVRA